MSGFDNPGVFFTEPFYNEEQLESNENRTVVISQFRDFILQFQNVANGFVYRDKIKHNYNLKRYFLDVDINDLAFYKEDLADKLIEQPIEYLPLFELAAREAVDQITHPRPSGEEIVREIQVILSWLSNSLQIRDIKSDRVSKLVKLNGVVVSVSSIKTKAVSMTIQCRSCHTTVPNIKIKPGIESYQLPRKCPSSVGNPVGLKPQCPMDPFFVMPNRCSCVDSQVIRLQEMPDATPTGEMPRTIQLYCDRNIVDCVSPGNKITVLGIYCIRKMMSKHEMSGLGVGLRKPYVRVVGIEHDYTEHGFAQAKSSLNYSSEEIEEFRKLSKNPKAYEIITKSIAPSIYGCNDIKKAVACHLFGGSSVKLPDGLTLRGDINVLLLGDPGTAKSQILKFVEKVAPIGVYTSGKGSSAAGLTASINRDPGTGAFIIEGGAMVLADGGSVCIDEFDKMREDDRVAIHEAMEQQTISIAKAGITTTLNSRCAVIAAANSVFGRWDDLKGSENINFMPTILSRFDMIFIVKDEHSEEKDIRLAKHVIKVHTSNIESNAEEGELSLSFLKKYIDYCRKVCGPRLTKKAAERLKQHYVKVRSNAKSQERASGKRSPIVITVRQLEAISRISESLAKMRLSPFVNEEQVEEAIRLFHVSTWDAANRGGLAGAEGFTGLTDIEEVRRIETQIKQRFPVGTQVSHQRIIDDLLRQRFTESAVIRVMNIMVMRGDIEHRLQGKIVYRVR